MFYKYISRNYFTYYGSMVTVGTTVSVYIYSSLDFLGFMLTNVTSVGACVTALCFAPGAWLLGLFLEEN